MAKHTISIVSLILITQLKAARLLQQVTCASTLCMIGTQCYDTANGPICCDPNICQKGKCGGNGLLECEPDYQCVAGNCPKGMTDCPGNCINANAKPQIGDACDFCRKPLCACNFCADRQNVYGCCGGCSYKDDGNGNLNCGADPIIPETNCPDITPVEGESCGVQGMDCDNSLAPEFTCSDGISCYGNCGTCTYQQDEYGNLNCVPAFISQESVCPIENCGGFENCDSYTPDGCNTCGCPKDGSFSFCTLMACSPELVTQPECRVCSDGYTLNPFTKQCQLTYQHSIGCGIDNCNSYFDGCNDCFCNLDGTEACTEKACKQLLEPYCTGCEPGYILNPSTDGLCLSSTTTVEPIVNMCCDPNDRPGFNGNPFCFEGAGCCPDGQWACSIGDGHRFGCGDVLLDSWTDEMGRECCGGFSNCKNYYDGCNDCFCGENGMDGCTKKWCLIHGESKCNECEFEYRVNDETGQCVIKKSCNNSNECDVGFKCRVDPMCRGQRNSNPLCMNAPNVCLDYDSRNCKSDLDCDVGNGYKCYGVNNQGNGVCGKYE